MLRVQEEEVEKGIGSGTVEDTIPRVEKDKVGRERRMGPVSRVKRATDRSKTCPVGRRELFPFRNAKRHSLLSYILGAYAFSKKSPKLRLVSFRLANHVC